MAKQLITGCTLEDRTIEWTTLRDQAPQEPEQVQFESVEVAVPDDVERIDFDAPEASDAVKRACKSMKGTLALALPAEVALLRVADFPTTDPEELDGMVDIYVDQFAPFPMDQVMVSWEYLAQQEESARVLVVAVRLSYVESLGGLFKRAGFLPHQMDVDLLGWWRLLNDEGKISESGRHILIIATAECVNLVVAQDGAPILFRSLGGLGGRASDSVAAEVAEELDYTLTAVEADRGGVSAAEVTIWHRGAEPTEMKSAVEAGSGLKASTERLETLPPLCEGIARRAADGAERRMDLTPTEWHEEEKARATKQKLMGASAVFLLLWMLVMAGLYIGPAYRLRSIGKMRIKVTNLKAPAEEAKQIEAKVQDLLDYGNRELSSLECLREISAKLPEGLDLTSCNYKKGQDVSLRGLTSPGSVNLIYKFLEDITSSGMFVRSSNQRVSMIGRGASRRAQFSVVLYFEPEEVVEE